KFEASGVGWTFFFAKISVAITTPHQLKLKWFIFTKTVDLSHSKVYQFCVQLPISLESSLATVNWPANCPKSRHTSHLFPEFFDSYSALQSLIHQRLKATF